MCVCVCLKRVKVKINDVSLFYVCVKAYEDVLRHLSDRKINNSRVRVLKDGTFVESKWADIRCGNIIEVTADKPFPCDMVLLYSHTDDGVCHITTANLDGETNLKVFLYY